MAFKWRKWNRALHRDFGYLFFGVTLVYAISGIALNHLDDWDPNYVLEAYEASLPGSKSNMSDQEVISLLRGIGEEKNYRKHYYPKPDILKIFIDQGLVMVDITNGTAYVEKTYKRHFFREVNYLHYNPHTYWTWFADLYSGALVVLAISGLFIPRGSKGIAKRGAWLAIAGILIPLVYLLIYFY